MRSAAVVVLVAAACQTNHVVVTPSPTQQAADHELLYRLDHVLTTYRVPMCHELDRELPNLAPREPRSIEAMTTACDGGDAQSCDELGWLWTKADAHVYPPYTSAPDLEHFFGRGCDLGSDDACRAFSNVLRRYHKPRALLALAYALVHAGRTELGAEVWLDLAAAERKVFAPTFPALRTKLQAACASGNAKACETRAELEDDPDASWAPGPFDPKKRPWFVKACLAGSVNACGWALGGETSLLDDPSARLERDAIERTEEIVARVCDGPTCTGLVAALGESCRAGTWSSCYLAANACTYGGTIPDPRPPAMPQVVFIPADLTAPRSHDSESASLPTPITDLPAYERSPRTASEARCRWRLRAPIERPGAQRAAFESRAARSE